MNLFSKVPWSSFFKGGERAGSANQSHDDEESNTLSYSLVIGQEAYKAFSEDAKKLCCYCALSVFKDNGLLKKHLENSDNNGIIVGKTDKFVQMELGDAGDLPNLNGVLNREKLEQVVYYVILKNKEAKESCECIPLSVGDNSFVSRIEV